MTSLHSLFNSLAIFITHLEAVFLHQGRHRKLRIKMQAFNYFRDVGRSDFIAALGVKIDLVDGATDAKNLNLHQLLTFPPLHTSRCRRFSLKRPR